MKNVRKLNSVEELDTYIGKQKDKQNKIALIFIIVIILLGVILGIYTGFFDEILGSSHSGTETNVSQS